VSYQPHWRRREPSQRPERQKGHCRNQAKARRNFYSAADLKLKPLTTQARDTTASRPTLASGATHHPGHKANELPFAVRDCCEGLCCGVGVELDVACAHRHTQDTDAQTQPVGSPHQSRCRTQRKVTADTAQASTLTGAHPAACCNVGTKDSAAASDQVRCPPPFSSR
jgi:hypothetical protein